MANVLVLFAHPNQKHSRVNSLLARHAGQASGITFADLYAEYPKFDIDIDREQERLLAHDVLILQFPIYWYATPSLLKEWLDLVLEYGFAYGTGGDKLKGKALFPIVTAGGPRDAYSEFGQNNFRLRTLLSPLEQTANLCQMRFVPPFALFAANGAAADGRAREHLAAYTTLLDALRDDRFDFDQADRLDLLSGDMLRVLERPAP